MSKQKINGLSFSFDLGTAKVDAQKFTLSITDNSTVAKRNGKPDGYLQGDVEGEGSITVDTVGYNSILEEARKAKSWQGMPPFDINAFAKVGDVEKRVEVFGCKFKMDSVLEVDKSSTDEIFYEIPFFISSPDFVRIDGVSYVDQGEE